MASFGPDDGVAFTQAERDENYRPVNLGQLKRGGAAVLRSAEGRRDMM